MPAERAIGLTTEDLRVRVLEARRERVSEIVEGGKWERRRMRDSIAAMGGVRRGSVVRSWL